MASLYRAFISYSHADAGAARWLHGAIEAYRLPRALVAAGHPVRLFPVFRDRSDMRAGADLAAAIRAALDASDALIVICSPAAAASRYVDLEIRGFTAAHPDRPVIAVIAAGDPALGTCFPPALTDGGREPIAADLRPGGDGRRMTRLKVVAALLGIDLVQLTRRDDQRRLRRLWLLAAAALLATAVLTALLLQAIRARAEAERQRAAAEANIAFMVTDLRPQLEPLGRLSILDAILRRAVAYYAAQDPATLSPPSLAQRARVLRMIGQIQSQEGNLDVAEASFRAAAAGSGQLLARAPDDQQRIFDHAQDVFYIGDAALKRGRLAEAEAQFERYRDLAEQLVRLDPKKPEWQAEIGYAYSNIGTVLLERGRNREAEAAFRRVLTLSQQDARSAPRDVATAIGLAGAWAWLADALSRRGAFDEALAARNAEAAIYMRLQRGSPQDLRLTYEIGNVLLSRAKLLDSLGRRPAAIATVARVTGTARSLVAADPRNSEWAEQLGIALFLGARLQIDSGALEHAEHLIGGFDMVAASVPPATLMSASWRRSRADIDLLRSRLAEARGDAAAALRLAVTAERRVELADPAESWDIRMIRNRSRLRIAQLLAASGDSAGAAREVRSIEAEVGGTAGDSVKLNELLEAARHLRPA